MACPHRQSTDVSGRRRRTALGYKTFACRACRRCFNERTGTVRPLREGMVKPRGFEPLIPCLQSPLELLAHKTRQRYPQRRGQKDITINQPITARSHLIQYKYSAFRLCRIRLIYVRFVRS